MVPQFQRTSLAGSLGGPLRKDKTFVFGNYEGFPENFQPERRDVCSGREPHRKGLFPFASGLATVPAFLRDYIR